MSSEEGLFDLTEPVVMIHPNVITARPFKQNGKELGEPKFGAQFLIDPASPEWKSIQQHAAKVAKAAFGSIEGVKWPFKKGDVLADKRIAAGKADGEFQRGKIVLSARSKFPPKLSGFENGRIVAYDDEVKIARAKGKFFFGAEVLARLNFFTTDIKDEKRVSVYLNMVMVTGKGVKMAGAGPAPEEVFKGYRGGSSTVDPTGGDEIPF